jgi:hypothetical protein
MKKKIVIVDIDGTVSKVGDRLKYLQMDNPDWDSFYDSCFEDDPIVEIVDLVKTLNNFYDVIFCTGRRESVREITVNWLINQGLNGILLMRPNGDKRHDTDVKPEQIVEFGIKFEEIAFVLEDRNSMVAKWRELGVKCLQVEEGNF